jgi:putative transposase
MNTVQRAFKYRFYPTFEQERILNRHIGAARFVWNWALAIRSAAWTDRQERITGIDLMRELTKLRNSADTDWLSEVSATVMQQVLRDQDTAFKNFFDGLKGKRPRMGYPRFKARATARKSLRYTRGEFSYRNGQLFLAKMREEPLNIMWSRPLPEGVAPSSVTVSCDPTGRWHISILTEDTPELAVETGLAVGIDLGIKTFAALSDETVVAHPALLRRHELRLKRYQKRLSRCQKGSLNRAKARVKVARQHAKVADARRDFLHKTSTAIINRYDVICIEDLAVKNMVKNHCLAKSISDCGWAEFRRQLEYKAAWYGKRIIVIDRFHPSSRLCSDCGWKNLHLKLSDREWVCLDCGTLHDRDINAAKNILAAGLAATACGEDVRPKKKPRASSRKGRQPSAKQELVPSGRSQRPSTA